MPNISLNFVNNTAAATSDQILIFLQPVQPQPNYLFSAWSVLNPSIGSIQSTILSNNFSGSIASLGKTHGNYSKPVALTLGKSNLIANPNNQSPVIGVTSGTLHPEQVGLENQAITPPTHLSVKWYVNNSLVVETNNTTETALKPGSTATFQLKQSIYCMLAQVPILTETYTLQTFSQTKEFSVPNSAAELCYEVYTDKDGINKFREINCADMAQFRQQSERVVRAISAAMQPSRSSVYALGSGSREQQRVLSGYDDTEAPEGSLDE
jgi:hypothetical protein